MVLDPTYTCNVSVVHTFNMFDNEPTLSLSFFYMDSAHSITMCHCILELLSMECVELLQDVLHDIICHDLLVGVSFLTQLPSV